MDEGQANADARVCAAEIVASYVTHNALRVADLPDFIRAVYGSLTSLGRVVAEPAIESLTRPMSVKRSINHDYLISMEDGRQYRSLKRHLAGRGLSPMQYRAKWDLPADYPMVAAAYSERRSALAKSFGLGRKPAAEKVIVASEAAYSPASDTLGARRGRKKAVSNGAA